MNWKSFVILVMENVCDIFINISEEETWVIWPGKIPNENIIDKIKEDLGELLEYNNQNLIVNDFINLYFQYQLNSVSHIVIIYLNLL